MRLAYVAERAEPEGLRRVVVVEGEPARASFERIRGTPRFSPDGRHVAYVAEVGARQLVVVDDAPGKTYTWIRGEPTFTPDSSAVVVLALGADERFDAGDELPADPVQTGATRLVLDRTQGFKQSLRVYVPERLRKQPLPIVRVEERIGFD
jgi:hypothetical protein